MKKIPAFAFVSLILICTGCQTLQVKRAHVPTDAKDKQIADGVPGMPFYIKKAACAHSVVWFEPVYTLTLELTNTPVDAKAKPTTNQLGTAVLSLKQLQSKNAQDLFHAMNDDSPTINDVMKAWTKVATQEGTPYTPTNFPDASNRILVSNTSEPQLYVDYSQPYYLNVTRPVAGSAKIDNKLAGDGTLTEVSAEIEDKTIETIATGIKDIVTAVGTAAKSLTPEPVQKLKLSVVVGGFKHTLSKLDPKAVMPCAAAGEDVAAPYTYSRTEISAPAEKKADSKGSKISVTGEILLPEAKPADDSGKPKAPTDPVPPKKAP
jgi:hypothetical protein